MATGEPKKVVGLGYEVGQGLPRVVVKGSGKMAEQILRQRDPNNGPMLVKDAQLLEQLYRLPMDAEIGAELFHLVAALLAHVFAVEEKMKEERY
jgi:type III secretion system FlhB-like substrate exporter